jgi:hypothetical protein
MGNWLYLGKWLYIGVHKGKYQNKVILRIGKIFGTFEWSSAHLISRGKYNL